MSKPPPDTTDNFAAAPERIALIVEQALLLADIATAGAHLGQQMVRQAEQANWLGVEGALLFARVNRAVRQTIAMERSLGAHFEDVTERQRAKLYALMNAGGALIQRLTRQNLDRNFLDGPGGVMMLRLSTATERTMQLLRRIDDEKLLSDAHRSAIWNRRPRRPRPLPKLPQRAARTEAPNVAANTPPNTPPMGSSDISLAMRATLLEESLDDIEGDIKGTEDPVLAGDVHAPDEIFDVKSVEAEIGDRSLAEIAAAACKLVGMVPPPALVAAPDEAVPAATTDAPTDAPVPAASPTSPGLSAPMEHPAGRRGEDGVAPPGPEAGPGLPPTPQQPAPDPPPSG